MDRQAGRQIDETGTDRQTCRDRGGTDRQTIFYMQKHWDKIGLECPQAALWTM